jgi:hypothetical protein
MTESRPTPIQATAERLVDLDAIQAGPSRSTQVSVWDRIDPHGDHHRDRPLRNPRYQAWHDFCDDYGISEQARRHQERRYREASFAHWVLCIGLGVATFGFYACLRITSLFGVPLVLLGVLIALAGVGMNRKVDRAPTPAQAKVTPNRPVAREDWVKLGVLPEVPNYAPRPTRQQPSPYQRW